MKIRKIAPLMELYDKPQENILYSSPEIVFMNAVCAGLWEQAERVFERGRQFSPEPVAVDAPYGRFEGLGGIRRFCEGWLSKFNAVSAVLTPMFQTRSGGRSVTEAVVNFVVDGMIEQVPMFLVGDLRGKDGLEELRIYCHSTYVPGQTPYRKPMFRSAHLEMGDPGLLTGAVREYYEALHHVPGVDVERILACMHPGCLFGGYEPWGTQHAQGEEGMRHTYQRMAGYIPAKVAMRYETIIDDGVTGVIEWVHVISDKGRSDLNRVALSGIAAYQRGEDGRLIAIRICDYAGYENQIDWTKTPVSKEEAYQINAVKEFPAGVGRKPQRD